MQAGLHSYTTGAISQADLHELVEKSQPALEALDTAKAAIAAGDPTTANGKLAAAVSILTAVQSYLDSKLTPPGKSP